MEMVFPDGYDLFQQDNVPCQKAKKVQEWFEKNKFQVDLASKASSSQSNLTSVGCPGQTSQLHGGPISQLKGLRGSVANILLPDTTAHNQGSLESIPRRVRAVSAAEPWPKRY